MRRLLVTGTLIPVISVIGFSLTSCNNNPFEADDVIAGAIVAGHEAAVAFDTLPANVLEHIRDDYRIYYGHTSHGSQIMTGLNMLAAESPAYAVPDFHEVGGDLGHNGDVTWASSTRAFLDANPGEYNVVMWSWCGGVSDNTAAGIQLYLDTMTRLETDYPDVTFIYMTGHLDGTGANGNLYARNNQIRDFTAANGRTLFDFADVESYDPAGHYYPDESDNCGWCSDWCGTHSCPTCASCAHSHCFNCYLKGKAFWSMMAQIAGRQP
jgi:hypothetical protein